VLPGGVTMRTLHDGDSLMPCCSRSPLAAQCDTVLDCCPDDSACSTLVLGKCCPNTAQTCGGTACADPGTVCCSDYVCPSGLECNELGGGQQCCEPDEEKCDDACKSCAASPAAGTPSLMCPNRLSRRFGVRKYRGLLLVAAACRSDVA
jgi:hypothetical protein